MTKHEAVKCYSTSHLVDTHLFLVTPASPELADIVSRSFPRPGVHFSEQNRA